jgi:hypothetical protein
MLTNVELLQRRIQCIKGYGVLYLFLDQQTNMIDNY